MLNTESRSASVVIWLAIAFIVAQFLWTFFAWPPLHVVMRGILDSEAAAMIGRNQTVIGSIVGLGGLALAYVLNGWRDRAEARHAIERREKRLAAVLAREAEEIAGVCEQSARQLVARGAGAGSRATGTLAAALAPGGTVLLGGSIAELATLGAGAGAAARRVRMAAGRVASGLATGKEDPASLKAIALDAMETAVVARQASSVLATVAARGAGAGDRIRLLPGPASSEIEAALSVGGDSAAPRLLPAA